MSATCIDRSSNTRSGFRQLLGVVWTCEPVPASAESIASLRSLLHPSQTIDHGWHNHGINCRSQQSPVGSAATVPGGEILLSEYFSIGKVNGLMNS